MSNVHFRSRQNFKCVRVCVGGGGEGGRELNYITWRLKDCVLGAVSSLSCHHPREVALAQFGLYVHKCGLKPYSFHFFNMFKD